MFLALPYPSRSSPAVDGRRTCSIRLRPWPARLQQRRQVLDWRHGQRAKYSATQAAMEARSSLVELGRPWTQVRLGTAPRSAPSSPDGCVPWRGRWFERGRTMLCLWPGRFKKRVSTAALGNTHWLVLWMDASKKRRKYVHASIVKSTSVFVYGPGCSTRTDTARVDGCTSPSHLD